MPGYDTDNFDPPAPVAHVTLHHLVTGASLSDVPMLIDTGADVSFLPRESVEQLGGEPVANATYEIQGFEGETRLAQAVQMELVFLRRKYTGQFLITDQPMGILGRIILNTVAILFDGPAGKWSEPNKISFSE
jgi:predicted aspartyl protease